MTESLRKFLDVLKEDESLREKLIGAKSHHDVVEVAKQHGHIIHEEIHMSYDLTDEDLENVQGGLPGAPRKPRQLTLSICAKYGCNGGCLINLTGKGW